MSNPTIPALSGRRSAVKMRSRPIDLNKPLRLTDTAIDIDLELQESILQAPPPSVITAIPIPPINIDTNYYDRFLYTPYHNSNYYIKFHLTTGASLISIGDHYDLLSEDIEWINQYNTDNIKSQLTEDQMESLIDLFEKVVGAITIRSELMSIEEKIDPSAQFTLAAAMIRAATKLNLRGKGVEAVYHYWIGKRKRLGKSLMRIFQEPPPRGNTDPHIAFRPRTEGRRISKRNPRKDDVTSYQKMHQLKRDFNRCIELADLTIQRENMKTQLILASESIFEEKLNQFPIVQKLLQASTAAAVPPSAASNNQLNSVAQLIRQRLPLCTYTRVEPDTEPKKSKKRSGAVSNSKSGTHQHSSHSHSHHHSHQQHSVSGTTGNNSNRSHRGHSISSKQSKLLSQSSANQSNLTGNRSTIENTNQLSDTDSDSDSYLSSSSDEYYSSSEDPEGFFESLEDHLASVRLNKSIKLDSNSIQSPGSITPAIIASIIDESELLIPPSNIPEGIIGRCRPRLGRGGRLWIDRFNYSESLQSKNENNNQNNQNNNTITDGVLNDSMMDDNNNNITSIPFSFTGSSSNNLVSDADLSNNTINTTINTSTDQSITTSLTAINNNNSVVTNPSLPLLPTVATPMA